MPKKQTAKHVYFRFLISLHCSLSSMWGYVRRGVYA